MVSGVPCLMFSDIILCKSREALSGLKKEDRTVHAENVGRGKRLTLLLDLIVHYDC